MRESSSRYALLSNASFSVRLHRRSALVVSLGLLSLLALALYSLTLGDYGLSIEQSLRRLVGDGGPTDDFLGVYFVQSVRLPRVIAAVAVGCSLGVAGALIGGLASGALIVACAGGVRVTGVRVVLVGIGCSAALRALNSLLIVKAPLEAAQRAQLWSAGSFAGVTMPRVSVLVVVLLAVSLPLAACTAPLGLLAMGDDVATGLGVRVRRLRVSLIATAIVLVSLATAVAGPVAFVALSAPHVARRLCAGGGVGLASSAVLGGLLVLVSDVVAQRLLAPHELPVGVVTGVVGGVYLLFLLVREVR